METVFGKELLLETILSNLGPRDLKETRRVSKQWSYRSTRILLAKQLLTVTHAFQHSPNDEQTQKLLLLETVINQSPLFPSCSFALSNCNLSSPDVQHVLSTFGHMIHTLNISLDNENLPGVTVTGGTLLHSFKHLLYVQLPNLEKLTLKSKTLSMWETEITEGLEETSLGGRSNESNLLPKLKCLRVESELPENIFELLIKAGVNIEEVELHHYCHEELLDVLRRRNKMHLVTTAFFLLRSYNLDLVDHFSNINNLKIKTIFLFVKGILLETANIWFETSKIMGSLLNACAHSLEVLQITPLFFLPQFQFPIMPRLQVLFIFVLENSCRVFAPTKVFKMSHVFPSLTHVYTQYQPRMLGNFWSKEMFENNFLGADYEDSVSTVTTLQFEKEPEFVCVQKLPLLFPNIKKLVILNVSRVSDVLHVLWGVPTLEALDFGVTIETLENLQNQNASLNTEKFIALDAALTGISGETCAHLSSTSESLDAATLEKLRLNKSMLDAKRLERLCIRIDDDSTENRTSPTKSVLSKIAFLYAFEMCPAVKVEIILSGKEEENVKYLLEGVSCLLSSHVEIKKEKKSLTLTQTNNVYTLIL